MNYYNLILALIIYILIDAIMMQVWSAKAFGSMIAKIQKGTPMKVRLLPAFLCFVALSLALNYFALPNIRKNHIIEDALYYAFPLGLLIYAVFDMTNLAIFSQYEWKTGLIDMVWGGVLTFLVAIIVKKIEIKYFLS